jgi:hypothetical protein
MSPPFGGEADHLCHPIKNDARNKKRLPNLSGTFPEFEANAWLNFRILLTYMTL